MRIHSGILTVLLASCSANAFTLSSQPLLAKTSFARQPTLFSSGAEQETTKDSTSSIASEPTESTPTKVPESTPTKVDAVVKKELFDDVDGLGAAVEDLKDTIKAVDFDKETGDELKDDIMQLMIDVEAEAEKVTQQIVDDECEVDDEGEPADELCADDEQRSVFRASLKGTISQTMQMIRGMPMEEDEPESSADEGKKIELSIFEKALQMFRGQSSESVDLPGDVFAGDALEMGWYKRGESSSIRRNSEVWKFALKCVFRALKPRSMKKKGAPEEEVKQAQVEAAEFIRDGLLTLGPTFVKLGQVVSTRTDVLPATYTDVLKTLQDDVPAFSGIRAKDIVSQELGRPCDDVFTDFSTTPLKAASLGQVHTAFYKGQKIAIKVQRAGLKELFDGDLKNLRKLAVLLDKFDPKSDGADRDWISIYDESERLLYLEIDYLNEADNCERFAKDFRGVDYVRVPRVYRELTTPKVLVMEFVESLKLTELDRIDELGLDRKLLAKRTADAFLRQIVETSLFHCDPHPGNLCVDEKGNLVYYDFGMMDELKPNVREGFRTFCTALFAGGPTISDTDLARNAKKLVDGVEEAGVLARGADRLAVEKLARFFMRSFKDNQLGKSTKSIKETLGTDLQTLTENNVFRFPSTFTFIFRAFASVEGIGKGLDSEYDIGKLAQPFIEKFTEKQKNYSSEADKNFSIFRKVTGLNKMDIETAVTSPKKIAYIEDTLRSMESGELKIRVRSLENEKALERMAMTQTRMENIMLATVCLNVAGIASKVAVGGVGYAGTAFFLFQAFMTNAKVKKFDKTQAKFVQTKFAGDE